MFQFQIGAIGSMALSKVLGYNVCFNSRLVRLVASSRQTQKDYPTPFQFQIGAIGSSGGGSAALPVPSFNSRLVRLVACIA